MLPPQAAKAECLEGEEVAKALKLPVESRLFENWQCVTVGRQTLYQLSYSRNIGSEYTLMLAGMLPDGVSV